ncbi:MAG: hypothetical protein KA369_16870 [Spirochaetes bacterium]|nr:hypothetical protein [Spirochaetota bacterium]
MWPKPSDVFGVNLVPVREGAGASTIVAGHEGRPCDRFILSDVEGLASTGSAQAG